MESSSSRVVRFGVFEFDRDARELRKRGVKVRIQDQPFRVLEALLERPGSIVTREQLKERLWAEDEFVEFDKSLNTAIQKIRQALDDSATSPRFLETLPRVGYRFVAAVEQPVRTTTSSRLTVRAFAVALAAFAFCAVALLAWFKQDPESTPEPFTLQPKPLTAYSGAERSPSLSPDGTQVAFEWNGPNKDNFDIYVQVIGAAEPHRVTDDPAPDYIPEWSPDGRHIAFLRDVGDDLALFVVSPHGDGERRLLDVHHRFEREQLGWTPDSREIVYRGPSPEGYVIHAVAVDTGKRRQLTSPGLDADSGRYLGDAHPTFSPDGRRLAFVRRREVRVDEIWIKPATGGAETPLTARSTNISKMYWTADSRELLYSSLGRVFRTSVDNGAPERIRGFGGEVRRISVARSAPRIAWSQAETDQDIWKLELDDQGRPAGTPVRVASTTRTESDPEISPDGKRLAFMSNRSGSLELWLTEVDGANPIQLTRIGSGAGAVGSPRWSPESDRIVFDAHAGDPSGQDIWVVDASGAPPRDLTNTPGIYEGRPAFSSDGRWIYYRVNQDQRRTDPSPGAGSSSVWRIPSGGGDAVVALDEPAIDFAQSLDGNYLYFSTPERELRRILITGGASEVVARGSRNFNRRWSVSQKGVYWLNEHESNLVTLELIDPKSGISKVITELNQDDPTAPVGFLSITSDSRSLVFTRTNRADDDLYYSELE